MPFKKGQSGNPYGKKKGTESIQKRRFKIALNELLENSSDQMIDWLGQIEDPKERFDVLAKFVEFIHPKLARTENHNAHEEKSHKEWLDEVREPDAKKEIPDD